MTLVKCLVGSMILPPAAPKPPVEPCPIRFVMLTKPLVGVKIDYAKLRNDATRGTKTRRQHELAAARAAAKAAKASQKAQDAPKRAPRALSPRELPNGIE